jgi:hypothetical protein
MASAPAAAAEPLVSDGNDGEGDEGATAEDDDAISAAAGAKDEEDAVEEEGAGMGSDAEPAVAALAVVSSVAEAEAAAEAGSFLALASAFLALRDFTWTHESGGSGIRCVSGRYSMVTPRDEKEAIDKQMVGEIKEQHEPKKQPQRVTAWQMGANINQSINQSDDLESMKEKEIE